MSDKSERLFLSPLGASNIDPKRTLCTRFFHRIAYRRYMARNRRAMANNGKGFRKPDTFKTLHCCTLYVALIRSSPLCHWCLPSSLARPPRNLNSGLEPTHKIPAGGYGEDQNLRYLVMSRLGPDVEAAQEKGMGWSLAQKVGYARQMLALLRTLHETCKMVFVDVKPGMYQDACAGEPPLRLHST